jgi:FkbM family methyltransferase
MANGLFELAVTEVMAHEIEPGMNVIDIGANVGYYSLLMADLVGDSGHVHVIEPNPTLEASLRRSLCLNGFDHRFTYVPHPLADQDDREVSFIIPRGDSKNARIVHPDQFGPDAGRQITLKTRKLDSVIPPGTKIDLIKMDVEGAEMLAWEGMQRILKDNPQVTIVLEFNAGRSYDPGEFLKMIAGDGFTLAYIDGMRGVCEVSASRLLGEKVGEDWMLYLKRPESWSRTGAMRGKLAESYAGSRR